MNKKINLILFFSFIFSTTIFANIKEIQLLDEVSSQILEEVENKNINFEIKKEKNKKQEAKVEKIILDEDIKNKNENKNLKYNINLKDIVDIYEKRVSNNIAYRGNQEEPFTGIFGSVSLDKIQFYETFKNGLLDGETAWFNEDGVKMISEYYKKAKLDGEQKAYYSNGKLKSIVLYKNNKIEAVVAFDKNGKQIFKSIFKNGTGKWKFYWSNGKLFEEGSYVSYKKDGVWKRYREDGSLDTYFEYKNGRLLKERWE